jgi:N-acetylmuramoyl-L-alanine amidase
MGKYKIAIDSGHGSNTAGKRTPPFLRKLFGVKKGEQYREHYANTEIAKILYTELALRGYDVIRTGWNDANAKDDPDESLSSRQKKIKAAKCDVSVSIHFNAYGDGNTFNSAEGVSVHIHDKYANQSEKLAKCVLNELTKGTKQKNRGIVRQALALCNCRTMGTKASILIEAAFMTNEREAELMVNPKFWLETAVEIANGIEKYFK